MDISNGIGIGISLFVQGCHFHCKNCFNKSTWDFNDGKEWDDKIENEFINLANKDYIKRISILGGEPLANENVVDIYNLIIKFKDKYKETKKIWIYTGYNYDDLTNINKFNNYYDDIRRNVINLIDVLVDGRYIDELKDINYKYAGSTNQRVIDINKTKLNNQLTLLEVD